MTSNKNSLGKMCYFIDGFTACDLKLNQGIYPLIKILTKFKGTITAALLIS